MINPFSQNTRQMNPKEMADYQMSMGSMSGQEAAVDEMAMLEKKEQIMQVTRWQQDRSKVHQDLFLKFCGYYYDDNEKILKELVWKDKWKEYYLTIFGAQKLVNYIEPLDRNVMLASWNENNIRSILRQSIAHPLRFFIYCNHKELGVNIKHAEYVLWLVLNTVEPTYYRGLNDGERRKDKEIIKVNELRSPYLQKSTKAIFGIDAGGH